MNTLDNIRESVEEVLGRKILLKADKGRRRIVEREGILEASYPNIFLVKLSEEYNTVQRLSYTYSDILTGTVEVYLIEDSKQKRIF